MKKFAATCLLLIYFTFSAGATLHLHYCMGEFAGFSFSDTDKGACNKCGMTTHSSETRKCCKDVQVTPSISDDHKACNPNFVLDVPSFDLPAAFPKPYQKIPDAHFRSAIMQHPPGYFINSLFIQFRNFRV